MTPDAAPKLLNLAQPKADDKYRIRALRGYLRIARQMQLAAAERAQMCDEALKLAGRDEERLLALRVLEIHPSLAGLVARDLFAWRRWEVANILRRAVCSGAEMEASERQLVQQYLRQAALKSD